MQNAVSCIDSVVALASIEQGKLVKVVSFPPFDSTVHVNDMVCSGDEAEESGDEKDVTLEPDLWQDTDNDAHCNQRSSQQQESKCGDKDSPIFPDFGMGPPAGHVLVRSHMLAAC